MFVRKIKGSSVFNDNYSYLLKFILFLTCILVIFQCLIQHCDNVVFQRRKIVNVYKSSDHLIEYVQAANFQERRTDWGILASCGELQVGNSVYHWLLHHIGTKMSRMYNRLLSIRTIIMILPFLYLNVNYQWFFISRIEQKQDQKLWYICLKKDSISKIIRFM